MMSHCVSQKIAGGDSELKKKVEAKGKGDVVLLDKIHMSVVELDDDIPDEELEDIVESVQKLGTPGPKAPQHG